ncbi:hypothetical protein [Curtobacterium sp. MCBD17_030]|uniref:hypothetical protein n=1 Tax=Curtobacterium sp. MCBD17_030 TaxID=2175649 RepID=UPI0021AC846D|nr:hypothetical protein [Curtobacterium sp. MCBD17_030]
MLMRAWLLYTLVVITALAALLAIGDSFPKPSSVVFFVGTPVVVIGAGLGAKFVREVRTRRRTQQH